MNHKPGLRNIHCRLPKARNSIPRIFPACVGKAPKPFMRKGAVVPWCTLDQEQQHTHRPVTCPRPDTSAACSAGNDFGWYGRSGSSFDVGMNMPHCSADSSWRNPAWMRHRQTEREVAVVESSITHNMLFSINRNYGWSHNHIHRGHRWDHFQLQITQMTCYMRTGILNE